MTYDANPTLMSHKNRATKKDSSISTHEGIDVSQYTAINSSLIEFYPTSEAASVVYRFTFYINPYQPSTPGGRNCRTHFKLQENTGSWADVSGCEANELFESASSQPMCQRLITLRFRLAPWSGKKELRIVAKSYSSSYQSALHYTHFWSGSAQSTGTITNMKVYYPVVEIYETR
jgi:hypothetical protein